MSELKDLGAERAVLAGVCQHGNDAYVDVSDIVNTGQFSDAVNQAIYRSLEFLFARDETIKPDYVSILSAARGAGVEEILSTKDATQYLRAIFNTNIALSNVRKMAAIVSRMSISRMLCMSLDEAKAEIHKITGREPISQIFGIAENKLNALADQLCKDDENAQLIGVGLGEWLQDRIDNPVNATGISSGYSTYDAAIGGGFRRKTVNMIGARPKTGKTALVDNIALHVASKLNIPVINLDTEMDNTQHWTRLLAMIAGVPIHEIETGRFAKDNRKLASIRKAEHILESIPYHYLCVNGLPFEDILVKLRRWVKSSVGYTNGITNDCLVIYDYMKLTESSQLGSMQEYQALGFNMMSLHNFTVKYDVPCLSFIQLNREGATLESAETASGSDRIIWLCSNFSIYKKKETNEISTDGVENGNRKLIPIVARHGPCLDDGDYISFRFRGEYCQIEEAGTRNKIAASKGKTVDNDPTADAFTVEDDTEPAVQD